MDLALDNGASLNGQAELDRRMLDKVSDMIKIDGLRKSFGLTSKKARLAVKNKKPESGKLFYEVRNVSLHAETGG